MDQLGSRRGATERDVERFGYRRRQQLLDVAAQLKPGQRHEVHAIGEQSRGVG